MGASRAGSVLAVGGAAVVGVFVLLGSEGRIGAQSKSAFPQFFVPVLVDPAAQPLPNPTPAIIKEWGPLPAGRRWGSSAGVDVGPDGNIWAYDRCGEFDLAAGACDASKVDPILKFDRRTGKILASFGAGLFVVPHGLHVDRDGNVWVTDFAANKAGTKGHQVFKFSPEGKILMRLGRAGVAGNGPDTLNQPCDVITAPNGDIFVSDGHSGQNDNPAPGSSGRTGPPSELADRSADRQSHRGQSHGVHSAAFLRHQAAGGGR